MSKKLNRKELYDIVWSTSWFVITEQFGISMYRLLKICKENLIPTPSDDWWTETTINEMEYKRELFVDESFREDTMIEIFSDREIRQARINEIKEDIEESCSNSLTVPKRLFNPDQLILNAKYSLEDRKVDSFNKDEGFGKHLSILVTKGNITRSLRILDTFIKLIKIRGHSIELIDNEYKIHIGDESYEFSIREKYKRIESKEKWRNHDLEPTGQLILSVGRWSYQKEFIDSGILIEQKLSQALAYLEYIAEVWKRNKQENEKNRIKREEEERVAQEIKNKEAQEKERIDNLIKYAKAWNRANLLREFINEVEARLNETNKASQNIQEWLEWARSKADEHDPLNDFYTFLQNHIA